MSLRWYLLVMSDAFLVAGKLHLEPEAYAAWLASPAPGPDAVSDWETMYEGWYWHGKQPVRAWRAAGTVEARLSDLLSWATQGPWIVLLRYEAGVFRFFVMSAMGTEDTTVESLFATLRSAAAFKAAGQDAILYWSEPSGQIHFPSMLAVAVVEPGRSAFVSKVERRHWKADYADLERWYGAYLDDAHDADVWSRPAYADANFVKRVQNPTPPRT